LISNKLGEVVPSNDVGAIGKAVIRLLKNEISGLGVLNREAIRKNTLVQFGRPAYEERVRGFINLIK